MPAWRNWTGDQRCTALLRERPTSVAALQAAIRRASAAGRTIRVAGAGHSFGDLVLTNGVIISLDGLDRVLEIDAAQRRVTVEAGITLKALSERLAAEELALENLGDVNVQSVAGAISTATHGTGARLGNLATQVEALDLVTADGALVHVDGSDEDTLKAARVSLGALGVIARVTLRVVPAFTLRRVDMPVPIGETLKRLDEHVDSNEHFEFFLFPHAAHALTRTSTRIDEPPRPPAAPLRFVEDVLLNNGALSVLCQAGRAQPERIPELNRLITKLAGSATRVDRSDRSFASPRLVRFTESEWAVPRGAARDVLRAILDTIDRRGFAVNFPIEVRFVAADEESFLSPSWGRDTAYLAVHTYRGMAWEPYFRAVQEIALAFDGRPHWGKRHLVDAGTLAERYPRWEAFQAVRARLDPHERFTNAHVARVLGPVRSGDRARVG